MLSGKTKSEWRIDREIFHFDLNLIVICPDFYKKTLYTKKKQSTMPEQLYIYFLVDQNYYSARIRRRGR